MEGLNQKWDVNQSPYGQGLSLCPLYPQPGGRTNRPTEAVSGKMNYVF